MIKPWRIIVLFTIVVLFFPVGTLSAQTDPQVQHLKQYLNGQKILLSSRKGGPIYGTFYFEEIHFCPSGQYMLFGQSRKQTVLGNEQVNNWEDCGIWNVIHVQGQVALQYRSRSGTGNIIPIHFLPDGRIQIPDGISLQKPGGAQCR